MINVGAQQAADDKGDQNAGGHYDEGFNAVHIGIFGSGNSANGFRVR